MQAELQSKVESQKLKAEGHRSGNVGDLPVSEPHFHVGVEVDVLDPEVAATLELTAFSKCQFCSMSKIAEAGYA
jgi:hypothetical protein